MRFLIATFLLTLFATFVDAGTTIYWEDRRANESPGYCAWACLETCCRHQQIRAGYHLLDLRKKDPAFVDEHGHVFPRNAGGDGALTEKLDALHIRFKIVHSGRGMTVHGMKLVRQAVSAGKGAVVAVYAAAPTTTECHAVIVTDIDNAGRATIVDPNNIDVDYTMPPGWLQQYGTGLVIVLDR